MRLYTAAALLVSASAEVVRDGGVLIDGTRIVAAGPAGPLRASAGTEVIDLGDVTILPGLIDTHVHLGFDGGPGPVARMRATAPGASSRARTPTSSRSAATRCVTSPCCTRPSWSWRAGTRSPRAGPGGCTRPAAGMGRPWPNPPGRAPHDGLRPDHRR
jgi:hypothetical protein